MYFNLNNFSKKIINENGLNDTVVETVINNDTLDLYVTAKNDKVKFIELEWCFDSDEDLYVLGDVWERSYGELEFKKLCDNDRYMPWYFIATDKTKCFCFGVKTQPNAFISFSYTSDGIKALIDCRNGGCGVELNGRKLHIATFVYKKYDSADVYANLHDYCKTLCDNPTLPTERVYGGNNWYYAYGKAVTVKLFPIQNFRQSLQKKLKTNRLRLLMIAGRLIHAKARGYPTKSSAT